MTQFSAMTAPLVQGGGGFSPFDYAPREAGPAKTYLEGPLGEVASSPYAFSISDQPPPRLGILDDWRMRYMNRNLEFDSGLLGRHAAAQETYRQMLGEESLWKFDTLPRALVELAVPFAARRDVQETLGQVDEDFDPEMEWEVLKKDLPDVVMFMEQAGVDVSKFQGAENKKAFHFGVTLELSKLQLEQYFDSFADSNSFLTRKLREAASVATNWVLLDPDMQRLGPLGGATRVVGAAGRAVEAGVTGTRAALAGRVVGETLGRVDKVHPAVHKWAASHRLGRLAAVSVEGAALGVGFSVAEQRSAIEMSDLIYEDSLRQFSHGEAAAMGALGGLGVFAIYGSIIGTGAGLRRFKNWRDARELRLAAAHLEDTPLGRLGSTKEGLALQHTDDQAILGIRTRLNELTGENADASVSWALSRRVIEDHGRTVQEVSDLVERWGRINNAAGGRITPAAIADDLLDFLRQGRKLSLTPEETVAFAAAQGRDAARRINQRNPARRENLRNTRTAHVSAIKEINKRLKARGPDAPMPKSLIRDLRRKGIASIEVDEPITLAQARDRFNNTLKTINDDLAPVSTRKVRESAVESLRQDLRQQFLQNGSYTTRTPAGTQMRRIESLLDQQLGLAPDTPTYRRLQKQIEGEVAKLESNYPAKPLRVRDLEEQPRWADELTAKEKAEVIERIHEQAESVEVATGLNKLYSALFQTDWGRTIRGWVTNMEGVTLAEKIPGALEASALMGQPGYLSSSVGGAAPGARNLQAQKWRAERMVSVPIRTFGDVLKKAKVSSLDGDGRRQISIQIRRAVYGTEPLDQNLPWYSEGQKLVAQIQQLMKVSERIGVEGGLLKPLKAGESYMPESLNRQLATRRWNETHRDLSHWWREKALESDDLFEGVMEGMGWVVREALDDSKVLTTGRFTIPEDSPLHALKVAWEADPKNKGVPFTLPKTKSELGRLDESLLFSYVDAIDTPLDSGFTAIEKASMGFIHRNTGTELFSGDVRTWNKLRAQASKAQRLSEERTFTGAEIWSDERLSKWFDADIADALIDYADHTLFRVLSQQTMDQHLASRGIKVKGMSPDEYLNLLESRIKEGMNPTEAQDVRRIFDKYQETLAAYNGSLPQVSSSYTTAINFAHALGEKSASLAYGAGIGGTVAGVELNVAMATRNGISPGLMSQKMKDLGMTFKPGAERYLKSQLEGTQLELHRMRMPSGSRFVSGSPDSQIDFSSVSRLARPWKNFINTLRGEYADSVVTNNRAAQALLAGVDAFARTQHQIGLSQFMSERAWMLQMRGLKTEIAHFTPAAERLAGLMADMGPLQGTTEQQMRLFRAMARKAGFAGDWDVAMRMSHYGLLDRENLAALKLLRERSGQTGRHFDLEPMQRAVLEARTPAEFKRLDETYHRLASYIETETKKKVSEAWGLSRPTAGDARTMAGRMLNKMFSFSRSWVINNVYDGMGMPSAKWMSGLGAFLFWQVAYDNTRRWLRGEDPDVIADEWSQDPIGSALQDAMRVPWAGRYTMFPEYAIAAARRAYNSEVDNRGPLQIHQSAASGAVDRVMRTAHWAVGTLVDPDSVTDAQNHKAAQNAIDMFVPAGNAIYTDILDRIFDLRDRQNQSRGRPNPRLQRQWGMPDGEFMGSGPAPTLIQPGSLRAPHSPTFDMMEALQASRRDLDQPF